MAQFTLAGAAVVVAVAPAFSLSGAAINTTAAVASTLTGVSITVTPVPTLSSTQLVVQSGRPVVAMSMSTSQLAAYRAQFPDYLAPDDYPA